MKWFTSQFALSSAFYFSALFLDCGYSVDNSRRAGALEDLRIAIDSIQRLSLRCCPVNCDLHWSFHLPDLVLGMLRRNPIEHLLARDLFDFPAHPCAFSDHLSLLRLLVRRWSSERCGQKLQSIVEVENPLEKQFDDGRLDSGESRVLRI